MNYVKIASGTFYTKKQVKLYCDLIRQVIHREMIFKLRKFHARMYFYIATNKFAKLAILIKFIYKKIESSELFYDLRFMRDFPDLLVKNDMTYLIIDCEYARFKRCCRKYDSESGLYILSKYDYMACVKYTSLEDIIFGIV
jgi:hypothetical protein